VAYAIGGMGAGAVYGACVGTALKWFPDRRGLAAGFTAGSYGFGTALTVIPIQRMIAARGDQAAFITWGLLQGIVVTGAAWFMRPPPVGWQPAGWEKTPATIGQPVYQSAISSTPWQMVQSGAFWLMYLLMSRWPLEGSW
jgi:MFS transporter, OFA family, oxalate/formate antiporter